MPAYSFQTQFVPYIRSGRKFHTIRKSRNHYRPTVVGDNLKLFKNQRSRNCELILETVCTQVQPIIFFENGVTIVSDDPITLYRSCRHSTIRLLRLAHTDGFETIDDFLNCKLFKEQVNYEIVYWKPPTKQYLLFEPKTGTISKLLSSFHEDKFLDLSKIAAPFLSNMQCPQLRWSMRNQECEKFCRTWYADLTPYVAKFFTSIGYPCIRDKPNCDRTVKDWLAWEQWTKGNVDALPHLFSWCGNN